MNDFIYSLINNKTLEKETEIEYQKFLVFFIKNNLFAIEIEYIQEISTILKISKIPDANEYILGNINLRGNIIPIIDLNKKFFKTHTKITNRTCIIIVKKQEKCFGIVTDYIHDIISLPPSSIPANKKIIPVTEHMNLNKNEYNVDTMIILECEKIFKDIN